MIAAAALPVLPGSPETEATASQKRAGPLPLVAFLVSFVFVLCDRFGNVFISPGSWELFSAPWHDWPGVRRPRVWEPRRRLQAARRVSWDRCRGVRLGGCDSRFWRLIVQMIYPLSAVRRYQQSQPSSVLE